MYPSTCQKATLRSNFWTNFHEIVRMGRTWHKKQLVNFLGCSGSPSRSRICFKFSATLASFISCSLKAWRDGVALSGCFWHKSFKKYQLYPWQRRRRDITWCSAAQHSTTQHNTTQHNTTQHNTTQHNIYQSLMLLSTATIYHRTLAERSFVIFLITVPNSVIYNSTSM